MEKMYHYFVSYAINTDYRSGAFFGMTEILSSKTITCMDDILSFREDIAEELDTIADNICILSMPMLIQPMPY